LARSVRVRRLLVTTVTAIAVLLASSFAAMPAGAATTFVVLQMNLCNSGMAVGSCYSFGKAVDEAVEKIHRYRPTLVTLQEVCRDDLYAPDGFGKLTQAMADMYGSGHVSADFVPAFDRDTNDWYRCVNGELYGIAMIQHDEGRHRVDAHRGWYHSQDGSEEVRAWTCATVIAGRLTGCTTHLSTTPDAAMRQCRELMSILDSSWVLPEVVVAGDFNLTSAPGKPYNVQDCEPASYDRRSDNAVQQIFFSRNVQWVRDEYEPMKFTDHPMLFEKLRV
jgi:endonuclease/exonuclease/phosphatase family metal-dependent hydrolase